MTFGKSTINRWNLKKISQKTVSEQLFDIHKLNYIINFIKQLIDYNKFISIQKIQTCVFYKFNKNFSSSFIYNIIHKKLKYSYKKIHKKLYSGSLDVLNNKRQLFINNIKNININKIICIDETFIFSNYCHNYGWTKIGERLIHYTKSNPKNILLLLQFQ